MSEPKHEVWLQVSAGQGPAECAWAVVRTVEEIQREAAAASLEFSAVEIVPGSEAGTAESALVSIRGDLPLERFVESWCGTVQWIARSPFRPDHKRKNWFVGVEVLEPVDEARLTCRPEPRRQRWKNDRSIVTESWRWPGSYRRSKL